MVLLTVDEIIKRYTTQELIQYLIDYYNTFGESPTHLNLKNPHYQTFSRHFGSWNNALKAAGLHINKEYTNLSNKPNKCECCGTNKTTQWHNKSGLKICSKCYGSDRNYLYGNLDPNSTTGIGVIAEYVTSKVLNDCIKCNTADDFQASFDLISKKYGTINVKSSKLHNNNNWKFSKQLSSIMPDYYICIGFNKNRTKIQHVWIIPGNSNLVVKLGINIFANNLDRVSKYEVNSIQYNCIYHNLDINSLPEFRNSKIILNLN